MSLRRYRKRNWRSQKCECYDGCCGVTKLDKIRNERIRGTTKVGEIAKKLQERRLKWYGHVMRRKEGDEKNSIKEKEEWMA